MKELFWHDGRFGWPFVVAVVFLSLFLLAADLAWRVLSIPFETLAIGVVAAGILCLLCAAGLYLLLRRRHE